MSLNYLQDIAKEYAIKAVEHDRNGQYESAIFFYLEASQALINYKQLGELNLNSNSFHVINSKLNEYVSRAETLKGLMGKSPHKHNDMHKMTKTETEKQCEKILSMLTEAVNEDSDGNVDDAFEIYTNSIELFLKLKQSKPQIKTSQENELFKKCQINVEKALERAENLKKSINNETKVENKQQDIFTKMPDLNELNLDDDIVNNESDDLMENSSSIAVNNTRQKSSGSFTKEEIAVLRNGSFINGRDYLPFFVEIDSKEKFFNFQIPFTDKHGKLALSPSQLERFSKWARPDEIFDNPKLMMLVSSFSIKQTCISDCSFVASLTVCAQYERKFNKVLLSNIIYPQNKKGEPIFNPCGKYMVSFNLNGCRRKVIVDDYLPVDNYNNLLCSMTTNRGELWVSLLEKAYLKVMGGYDFPGSNSNIDLHALTNWIPERLAINTDHSDFDADADFNRMFERLHSGDVLITVATGPMNKNEEDRTGLVSTHAYAVLDIRKINGLRLFQIKNPWSHLRWKGKYSEYDINNWTDELKKALDYDPKLACNIDNGVFWIDYESLCKFFDVFYLSWNPDLFPNTICFHKKWSASEGPVKDRYTLGKNPQYVLRINSCTKVKKCSTWLLLTRHITDKADFAENKEYICLVVYKNNGKRVYYPMEPPPHKEGVRINSPHYLVKLVDDCSQPITYTLVISQYEKNNSVYYTLRAYSTLPFKMSELKEPYNPKYTKKIDGKWSRMTAGGCSNNHETYKNNPLYQVNLQNNSALNCLKIELKGPQQYSVGFDVICTSSNVSNNPNDFKMTSSGDFRRGYCVLLLNNISGGIYQIRPCTYLQGQEGPFILEICSNNSFEISQVK